MLNLGALWPSWDGPHSRNPHPRSLRPQLHYKRLWLLGEVAALQPLLRGCRGGHALLLWPRVVDTHPVNPLPFPT